MLSRQIPLTGLRGQHVSQADIFFYGALPDEFTTCGTGAAIAGSAVGCCGKASLGVAHRRLAVRSAGDLDGDLGELFAFIGDFILQRFVLC